jgi:hypothetical protein
MILFCTSAHDACSASFIREQLRVPARCLTPVDLSTAHWVHHWRNGRHNSSVASEVRLPTRHVRLVVSLLPAITPAELGHVVAPDRDYVAAEMHAFLRFWLSELTCPVINGPTGSALCGPGWSMRRWRWAAADAGFELASTEFHAAPLQRITVIGESVIARDVSQSLQERALLLARAAHVDLLTILIAVNQFVGSWLAPNWRDQEVAAAAAQYLSDLAT